MKFKKGDKVRAIVDCPAGLFKKRGRGNGSWSKWGPTGA